MRTLANTVNLPFIISILLLAEETGDSFTTALRAKYILDVITPYIAITGNVL